jgi:PAS domain S-box-containing protein
MVDQGKNGVNSRVLGAAPVIELSRYVVEPLQRDENHILYRGRSKYDVSRILVLSPLVEYPQPEILKRLKHEYSLRLELDPTWAARPVAISRHWERTVLVLEDPGGVPLDQLLGQPLDMAFALRLAVALSTAIGHLHQRGLIHKDIKPANVLVDSATGQCWLTGFGIASRLPRERQPLGPPEFIAGTLPYMAPEQTGRMNRSIDSRSDLYALGVTLYQMLTGSLPFSASDSMEWVHCHIARQPVPPDKRSKGVPASVSAIVMKLLAKTGEERYQTAAGLESDLRRCQVEWQIVQFPLAEHDTPDRLRIPEKLYGRDHEIDTLLASFDRVVAHGRSELVLVSGYSGIGKSSVINEIHKVLVPPRGLFASGKFDQYNRNIPYSTLAQAFQSLVRPVLAKSETELGHWRDALRQALGPNGLLMVDLVPELKLIIGEQPAVPDLPPQDAKARFQLVLRRFVGVFARSEHPLALFLDDLQWLDAATLDFLQDLLTQPDIHHLLLIGAYRDNEVDLTHPIWGKLDAIRRAGAHVHQIVLTPLTCQDLGRLLVDTLHCESERVTPLAQLVQAKTIGNPFFAIQFITALAEEDLLSFDHGAGRWSWDLNRIQAKGYTDNVAELMVEKLNRLTIETQKALQEFACLGNSASASTLSIVHGHILHSQDGDGEKSQESLASDLWEAERLELILRSGDFYRFAHDRIQEAAYSLIPEASRAKVHLRLGRLLNRHTLPHKREETVFEIVSQLNRGATLITSPREREEVAELNLLAGKRAKTATAYASALNYLISGAALLAEDGWEQNHVLSFALELNRAECEFLTGQLVAAEERLAILSSHTANTVELATVACLRMDLYTTLDQSDRAVAVCLDYLRQVNIVWSPHPNDQDVRHEYERICSHLGNRTIEDLLDSPLMEDLASFGTIAVLSKAFSPALFTDANLACLTICGAVSLSLERGICDASCFAFAWFGMIAGRSFGDYENGFRFGQVGYELVERRGLKRFEASACLAYVIVVARWTKHIRASRLLLRHAFEVANRIGDLTFGAYICNHLNSDFLFAGDPLPDVQREAENGLKFAEKALFGLVVDIVATQIALIRLLRGLTPEFGCFNDRHIDEHQFEDHLSSNPTLAIAACWYWIRKMQARYIAGQYDIALEASLRAQRLIWTSPCFLEEAEYHFYSALCQAASWDSAGAQDRRQHLEALTQHHERIQVWAKNCPENFENRAALVGAEIARIEGHELAAEHLYEQAIRSAKANDFVHNEALANELAARFYLARGFEKIGHTYLRDARHCYLRWGAVGKVRQLEELYPQTREEETVPGPTSTIGTPLEHLDLATVVEVSQAVSGEIVLERLVHTIMRKAIEHAGAQRGLLILARDQELQIEAEATTNGDTIVVRLQEARLAEEAAPQSIIRYVSRTHESVILDDALGLHPFSADSYIRQLQPRSILCLPMINQAKLLGLLYLENNLSPNVFTPTRIAVLKLLASQAAISLENTRLYRDLEVREAKIRRLVDADIIGIFIWNLEGEIIEANEAFLHLLKFSREDLVSGHLRWPDLTPAEWRDRDARTVAEIKATGAFQPFQKEYLRKDGRRVPVMIGGAMFEKSGSEGVAFVLDLSQQRHAEDERKRAEDALQETQAELAHVTRVAALGELTASIAHEINQPLGAVVNNASACLRWLKAHNLEEARQSALLVIAEGHRAGEIISRVRALAKKAPPQKDWLDINEAIAEVLAMVRNAAQRNRISPQTQFANDLPLILGDRIQLQQVILNLLINAIEAMSEVNEDPRELWVSSQKVSKNPAQGPHVVPTDESVENGFGAGALTEADGNCVLIAVRNTGPSLDPKGLDRVFDAFYTTKPQGLGMGLAISRSIIEAHGGRLWAANVPQGAVFQFTLPLRQERMS